MADIKNPNPSTWTSSQAYVLALICLAVGVAIGYLVRGSASPAGSGASTQATAGESMGASGTPGAGAMQQQPTPEQLRHMADKQAAPLLESLKKTPNDPDLLYKIGNVYYDTRQFPEAIQYYENALKVNPEAADVRTDLATAYHYMGDSDRALREYSQVLKLNPRHANALFNQGLVKWQGKMDIKGAIASWKQLLATNPDYPNRDQVQSLIARAEQHMNISPGTKTDKPAQIQ